MLAEAGIEVCIFEQNVRPFGKIEDGLPRWHAALRNKEYQRITEQLSHPSIHFLPKTRIGVDVAFQDLFDVWGFTAVVDRFEDMWFAEGKNGFEYHPHFLLRSLKELHIEFEPKKR